MKHFYRYLPLSEESRARGLSVVGAGYKAGHFDVTESYNLSRPNSPYPPHHPADHIFHWRQGRILAEYQLLYVTRGSGLFESRSCGLRPIRAGTIFMLFPDEWHRYAPHVHHGWDIYWVAFTGGMAAEHVENCQLTMNEPVVEMGVDTRLIEEYLRITDEVRVLDEGYEEIIAARTLLMLALAKAARLRNKDDRSYAARMIERAKGLLLERTDQPPPLEELALSLGVSYSWFRRMFRQHTGMSPAQYHLQYRIQRAGDLLTVTTLPIATIGKSLGFESAHYFARVFRQKTGYTPRDYRAKMHVPAVTE